MFQDTELIYVTLHIVPDNPKRIAVDNVPVDITCGQFLQKIAPLIYENEPKIRNQNQNAIALSEFNYCLRVGDKILSETDTLDSQEVDVIPRPEEITNLANIFILLATLTMYLVPLFFAFFYHNFKAAFRTFVLGAYIFAFFVVIFPEKKNYHSLKLKVKPKKNTVFEAIVILIRSFHPNFRLEDVLLDQ